MRLATSQRSIVVRWWRPTSSDTSGPLLLVLRRRLQANASHARLLDRVGLHRQAPPPAQHVRKAKIVREWFSDASIHDCFLAGASYDMNSKEWSW